MKPIHYRPDIDGLRAFAILPVLLYHAGVPGFSGGFIGVDIFFVISGFLITSILVREFQSNSYSIGDFYERRIRRIFPALLVVVLAVLLVGPLVLLPSQLEVLPREVLASLFFIANIVLWRDAGYFAPDAEAKPLLHMWSLGVEEQFYIFCPLLIWLVLRYGFQKRVLLVGLAAAASFVLCIYFSAFKPSASFYLLPFRAWELLAGSLLAVAGGSTIMGADARRLWREALAWVGLLALFLPVFFYDSSMVFPGYAAAAPVLGSALVLAVAPGTSVGRILSSKALIFIGGISYSLYLWHWPVMVYGHALGFDKGPLHRVMLIIISLALGYVSTRWIEGPTRSRQRFPTKSLLKITGVGTAIIALMAMSYVRLPVWARLADAQTVRYDAARFDVSPNREKCHRGQGLPAPETSCVLGGAHAHVAVWGDSHGVELAQALSEIGTPVWQITYSACAPALGWPSKAIVPDCERHNEDVADFLRSSEEIRTVVMVGYYSSSIDGKDGMLERFQETASLLADAGKRVVVVGPSPYVSAKVDIPTYLARGGERLVPYDADANEAFRRRMATHADAVVMPTDIFCNEKKCDLLFTGLPFAFDAHHPTMRSARVTAAAVQKEIRRLESNAPQGPAR